MQPWIFSRRAPRRDTPSSLRVEKWRCQAGVIKLHLQSTPHYNTAACASRSHKVGIPVEISRERATNDWRRRRHRKKTALQRRRKGPGDAARARAIAHDFAAFCSSIQATSSLAPSTPAPPTIARTFVKCLSTTLDLASYARISPSSPVNLTPSQTFAYIKMLRMNFFRNPISTSQLTIYMIHVLAFTL